MVGERESEDELSFMLNESVDWNAVGRQLGGREQVCLVAQELRTVLVVGRKDSLSNTFEPAAVFRSNAIPLLGGAKMEIIDRVKIHVLDVPCKRCFPHSKVEVRRVDSWQILIDLAQEVSQALCVP